MVIKTNFIKASHPTCRILIIKEVLNLNYILTSKKLKTLININKTKINGRKDRKGRQREQEARLAKAREGGN